MSAHPITATPRILRAALPTALLLFFGLAVVGLAHEEEPPSWEWTTTGRVVAVGDVHGAFDELTALLQGLGLVDEELHWRGGRDHLVLLGDLVDRGPDDRAVLDLAIRLQVEADLRGGRVHVVLGNHEAMNLSRDFRYVTPEGFAAFAEDEAPTDRRSALKRIRSLSRSRQAKLLTAFDRRYPPGFFGRLRAFGEDGPYGSWLAAQPAVVQINGLIFVHGGLTAKTAALGLPEINHRVQHGLEAVMRLTQDLEGAANGAPTYEAILTAAERLAGGPFRGAGKETAAAAGFLALRDDLAFSQQGPLWYRGLSLENERLERSRVQSVLEVLNASAVVVAHTPTITGTVTSRFDGRVFRTDVGMGYGAVARALVFVDAKVEVFDPVNLSYAPPVEEQPQGQGWMKVALEHPDEELEEFLARAHIVDAEELHFDDRTIRIVELRRKGLHARAVFQFVDETAAGDGADAAGPPRRFQHEIAAYRLDRMLHQEFVPVTVPRTIDRERGSLQIWVDPAIDLVTVRDRAALTVPAELGEQIARARVFTALVGTAERHDAAKMYLPGEGKILLGDHSRGFPTTSGVRSILERPIANLPPTPCRPLDAALDFALRSLDRRRLQEELGSLLSQRQIGALLGRRDRILEICSSNGMSAAEAAGNGGAGPDRGELSTPH